MIKDFSIDNCSLITANKKILIPDNITIIGDTSSNFTELKSKLFNYLLERDNLPAIIYCTTIACCSSTACYISRSFDYYKDNNKKIPAAST